MFLRHALVLALLAAALWPLAGDVSREVQAQRLQAEITSVCTQIPGLEAAVDYTLQTWPPVTTDDNLTSLRYFMQLVQADKAWCQTANTGQQPDVINQSARWHFGNASVALRQYQESARTATPAPMPPGPSARRGHSAVWDPVGTQMLVFGGFGTATLADLWSYRPATRTWTQLTPVGEQPAGRADHSAVWDPVNSQMLVFGGINGTGVLNDLWSYSPLTNTWSQFDPAGRRPVGRSDHGAVWDPVNNQMLVYGGCSSVLYCASFLGDIWSYQPASNAWTMIAGFASPGVRSNPAMVFDPVHRQAVVFGGLNGSGFLNDTWALQVTTFTWTRLAADASSGSNLPSAREDYAVTWDSASNQMLLFGGRMDCCARLNDLWRFNANTNTWSKITTVGAVPAGRVEASAAWNPVSAELLLFGGLGASDSLSDLWSYRPADSVWSKVSPLP